MALTPSQDSVHVGILTAKGYSRPEPHRLVISLYPGTHAHEPPTGENFAQVRTFLNQFLDVNGNYRASDFKVPG